MKKYNALLYFLIFLVSCSLTALVFSRLNNLRRTTMIERDKVDFELYTEISAEAISRDYFQWTVFYDAIKDNEQFKIRYFFSEIKQSYPHIKDIGLMKSDTAEFDQEYSVYMKDSHLFADFKIYNDFNTNFIPDRIVQIEFDSAKIVNDLQLYRDSLVMRMNESNILHNLKIEESNASLGVSQILFCIITGMLCLFMYHFVHLRRQRFFYNIDGLKQIIFLFEKTEKYSAHHSRKVAQISVLLGSRCGIKGRALKDLRVAALLHDIGKISIPVEILNKKGSLDKDEFEVVKQHVHHSVEIVEHFKELAHLKDIICSHHEKIDGTGYPQGLKGDQISLSSRVLAIADIFEALTGNRPYREPMPPDQAIGLMETMSLDAHVLGVLKDNLQSVSSIICQELDSPVQKAC